MTNLNDRELSESFRHKLSQVSTLGELAALIKHHQCFGVQSSFFGAITSEDSIVAYLGIQNADDEPLLAFDKTDLQQQCNFVDELVIINRRKVN
jgi:hypothetical protein